MLQSVMAGVNMPVMVMVMVMLMVAVARAALHVEGGWVLDGLDVD